MSKKYMSNVEFAEFQKTNEYANAVENEAAFYAACKKIQPFSTSAWGARIAVVIDTLAVVASWSFDLENEDAARRIALQFSAEVTVYDAVNKDWSRWDKNSYGQYVD